MLRASNAITEEILWAARFVIDDSWIILSNPF